VQALGLAEVEGERIDPQEANSGIELTHSVLEGRAGETLLVQQL
jgi:hypothetical protein